MRLRYKLSMGQEPGHAPDDGEKFPTNYFLLRTRRRSSLWVVLCVGAVLAAAAGAALWIYMR
jgi:hypothetical protein